jgi:hypothetical protein
MGAASGEFGTIDLDTRAFSSLGNSNATLTGMASAENFRKAFSRDW